MNGPVLCTDSVHECAARFCTRITGKRPFPRRRTRRARRHTRARRWRGMSDKFKMMVYEHTTWRDLSISAEFTYIRHVLRVLHCYLPVTKPPKLENENSRSDRHYGPSAAEVICTLDSHLSNSRRKMIKSEWRM